MAHSTNYIDTFIAVAPDTTTMTGTPPKEGATPTAAARAFALISRAPYRHTSDDVLFTVYAERNDIASAKRAGARKPRLCRGAQHRRRAVRR
jgi:hypothetical protein